MGPDPAPRPGPGADGILSVSELNRAVASLLERSIPPLWVAGEISNFTRAASGHWYFSLKDSGAQVRAVMFRGRAQGVGFVPREGDRVEVRALAGLYQPRGDFQLGVEQMRRAGAGDLYQRFLQLKEKLRAEGLLDEARKRVLPPLPARVGVVTSLQAAALRDVLATLAARAPQVPVVLYPTPVQGAEAPAGIVAALRAAALRAECDVLLLVRGGGSIEDLWSFNEEAVARAVAASPIPVVCGVGHETDFTIADFVADLRAPTPTAAAALAVPDRLELLRRVDRGAQRLAGAQERLQALREQRVDTATRLLRSPSAYLEARGRHLDGLARRATAAAAAALHLPAMRLARASTRLRPPDIQARGRSLEGLCARLARAQAQALQRRAEHADALGHKLELVSPQAVLGRGYAIVRREAGEIVRRPAQVSPGERLQVLLAEGRIEVDVSGDTGQPRP
jgi:exodeoxyribonuclease VII large subunit